MTVPPNTIAALSIWGTVWLSSKFKLKAPFIIGAGFVAILGELFIVIFLDQGFMMRIRLHCLNHCTNGCVASFNMSYERLTSYMLLEGGQYVGVLLAAAGIYTGNALLLRSINLSNFACLARI